MAWIACKKCMGKGILGGPGFSMDVCDKCDGAEKFWIDLDDRTPLYKTSNLKEERDGLERTRSSKLFG